jgi:hypothetical protein
MVTKTVRRIFSGLTSALSPSPKGKQRVAYTVKSAQQRADEAWRGTSHGFHNSYPVKIRRRDFRKPEAQRSLPCELAGVKVPDEQ